MDKKIFYGVLLLVLSTFACRPVLAISWNEFFIISILFALLLGPAVYRLARRVEEFFKSKEKNK